MFLMLVSLESQPLLLLNSYKSDSSIRCITIILSPITLGMLAWLC